MKRDKKEKEVINKLINCFIDQGIVQSQDFIIEEYNHGCFMVRFCPRRNVVLDIHYFYEMIPDIKIFKLEHNHGIMKMYIKIKIRK